MTARSSVPLPDGRTLSYLDLGDPEGVPVLFTMGTPSSAVGGLAFSESARGAGVRLISVDKPGYGTSTRVRRRSLLGYGQDLAVLADALGLDTVALAGQSGGGPHALAAAYVLGSRVSSLCLIAAAGPLSEPWAAEGLNGFMRTTTWFAQHAPRLMPLPVKPMTLVIANPRRMERMVERMAPKMTQKEREAAAAPEMRHIMDGLEDACRDGLGAACDEFVAIGRPWGFRLEDVSAQTDIWHGTADKSCPIEMARGMGERLPHATLHELPDAGHNFFGAELDQVMSTLRKRAEAAGAIPFREVSPS